MTNDLKFLEEVRDHIQSHRLDYAIEMIDDWIDQQRGSAVSHLGEALQFYDSVQASSSEDRAAVGKDHINWVLSAARDVVAGAQRVPAGWQLVPKTITAKMEAVYSNDSGAYQAAQALHDAMLAAAPKPEDNQ